MVQYFTPHDDGFEDCGVPRCVTMEGGDGFTVASLVLVCELIAVSGADGGYSGFPFLQT